MTTSSFVSLGKNNFIRQFYLSNIKMGRKQPSSGSCGEQTNKKNIKTKRKDFFTSIISCKFVDCKWFGRESEKNMFDLSEGKEGRIFVKMTNVNPGAKIFGAYKFHKLLKREK